ncbi:ethylene-responsive transcription factor ERF017-like [Impatiens glandulifera]|uniref:ethylene-responsive transcription factor ERF017-like n=1 Tax=Impatiens glandulifera TaxID=253017 RepID=UPI001FB19FB5|nr:ethylene-responsive transcription factor ERF017-like [Impatiens glandulifera]XP_047331830.1 ethylene-responsive transcription factor ERF017-like [Impatiens glandulifera]
MKPIPVKRVRGRYNYKGVRLKKPGKWVAESRKQMGRNKIWLGTYNTEKEAALAHDAAIVCLRGASSFASLNFPDDLPMNIANHPDSFSNSEIQLAAEKHALKDRDDAVVPVRLPGTDVVSEVDVILRIGRGAI